MAKQPMHFWFKAQPSEFCGESELDWTRDDTGIILMFLEAWRSPIHRAHNSGAGGEVHDVSLSLRCQNTDRKQCR